MNLILMWRTNHLGNFYVPKLIKFPYSSPMFDWENLGDSWSVFKVLGVLWKGLLIVWFLMYWLNFGCFDIVWFMSDTTPVKSNSQDSEIDTPPLSSHFLENKPIDVINHVLLIHQKETKWNIYSFSSPSFFYLLLCLVSQL